LNEFQGVALAVFGFIGGTSIISGLILRRFDKLEKKLDCKEEARIEESIVTVKMLQAIGHLAEATALAQQKGTTNGEMTTALDYYWKARDKLNDFISKRSAERTHSRG